MTEASHFDHDSSRHGIRDVLRSLRPDRLSLTIGRKLAIGFGFLIVFWCVVAVLSERTLRLVECEFDELISRRGPLTRATVEMEEHLTEIGFALLSYLHDHNPAHIQAMQAKRQNFLLHKSDYQNLVDDAGAHYTDELEIACNRFTALVDEMLRIDSEHVAAGGALASQLADIDDVLEGIIGAGNAAHDPNQEETMEAVVAIGIQAHRLSKSLIQHLRKHDPDIKEKVITISNDFRHFLDASRESGLSARDRVWATRMEDEFEQSIALAETFNSVDDTREQTLAAFIATSRDLNSILDDKVQSQAQADLTAARAKLGAALEREYRLNVSMAVLGVCMAASAALVLVRGLVRPVRRLYEGMSAVAEGELSHRVEIRTRDEFAFLAQSFNAMVEKRQQAELQLRRAHDELEVRVQERTENLASATASLIQLNDDLRRSNEELDHFAYIASHDLKEPLRGITNYATFIEEDYQNKLDEEGQTKLKTLRRLCGRMESLIDSLLYFSRVGRVDLAMTQTSLQEVVDEVLDTLQVSLAENNVDVRIPRPLPTVRCDRARIGEVFRNLITNAVKYNSMSERWVEVGYQSIDGYASNQASGIVFYVRDNGIGIPEKHVSTVFQLFKRLHGRDQFGGGTGMGLTIAKRIVERHGGRIWVESTHGEGTTFFFTLDGDTQTHERYAGHTEGEATDSSGGGQRRGRGGDDSGVSQDERREPHCSLSGWG